jgi:hypothetical protein
MPRWKRDRSIGLATAALVLQSAAAPSPLWRAARQIAFQCVNATTDQCLALLAEARRGAPMPIAFDTKPSTGTLMLVADLAAVDGRHAIALSARPSIEIDDAQGEWTPPRMTALPDEGLDALARRTFDRLLPWRTTRPTTKFNREYPG